CTRGYYGTFDYW
nr:immunoglobulin heavy chain junction region [Mus musculus]MBK4186996.1 immunoglobulin heavy chain junction region [Mus musculus]MBK4195213.1 immunoglobulin heavy chain junction region [Mus musculus]MBK4198055.1 immunoglobulin heavy chain junction region [Mus musculus]